MAAGRKPRAYSQTTRVLVLLRHLAARRAPVTLGALAERLGVSERQARRDCAALSEAGYAIEWERVDGRTAVRLAQSAGEPITLSIRERYTLLVMRRVFDVLAGTPFADDVQSIFEKIAGSMPEGPHAKGFFEDRFVYVPDGGLKPVRAREASILDAILTGVLHRSRVEVSYQPVRGKARKGAFEPWALVLYRHGIYAIGTFPGATHDYVLPVERFQSAKLRRGDHFEPPARFDASKYFEGAFGVFVPGERAAVVIEFDAAVAHLVRARRWHPTQKLAPTRGGGVRLSMRVTPTPDMIPWLLSWGDRARVKSPPAIRERVRDEMERALARQ